MLTTTHAGRNLSPAGRKNGQTENAQKHGHHGRKDQVRPTEIDGHVEDGWILHQLPCLGMSDPDREIGG